MKFADRIGNELNFHLTSSLRLPKFFIEQNFNSSMPFHDKRLRYNRFIHRRSQEKQLITHKYRHSFATSVALANNVSIENVANMLGHSDIKMTRHYAKVLDKSIMRDMANVNTKFTSV